MVALLAAGCAATTSEPVSGTPGSAPTSVALLETFWRLVEVDGKPVEIHKGAREPHIVLRREARRVSGFSGCNSLGGGYRLDGDSLRIGPLAMTRMACLSPDANATEAAFAKALEEIHSYRIAGATLELRDAAGAIRMRFEARQPR